MCVSNIGGLPLQERLPLDPHKSRTSASHNPKKKHDSTCQQVSRTNGSTEKQRLPYLKSPLAGTYDKLHTKSFGLLNFCSNYERD